jgi:hypothetical protein
MIYAYRLKDGKSKKNCMVEGFTVKGTWQFVSDKKVSALKKWPEKVIVIEAEDIGTVKRKAEAYDKEEKTSESNGAGMPEAPKSAPVNADTPLAKELSEMSLAELKDFAKANSFDEAEYSRLSKSKLLEYIVLGMGNKANA